MTVTVWGTVGRRADEGGAGGVASDGPWVVLLSSFGRIAIQLKL